MKLKLKVKIGKENKENLTGTSRKACTWSLKNVSVRCITLAARFPISEFPSCLTRFICPTSVTVFLKLMLYATVPIVENELAGKLSFNHTVISIYTFVCSQFIEESVVWVPVRIIGSSHHKTNWRERMENIFNKPFLVVWSAHNCVIWGFQVLAMRLKA